MVGIDMNHYAIAHARFLPDLQRAVVLIENLGLRDRYQKKSQRRAKFPAGMASGTMSKARRNASSVKVASTQARPASPLSAA